MTHKKLLQAALSAILLLSPGCFDDNGDGNPVDTDPPVNNDAESYGALQIILRGKDSTASFLGRMYDGPVIPEKTWEVVREEGDCKLLKPYNPFCEVPCKSGYKCVEDDSCRMEPTAISVGTLTMSGLITSKGTDPFTMDHLNYFYQLSGISLLYPPFNEGDTITLSASGSEDSPAFTLKACGFKPLTMLTGSQIPCGDGEGIDLSWEPPTHDIGTRIHIVIDITYHGGTKAMIEAYTDDDGSFSVSGEMMDALKDFGITGFPRVDITRITTSTDTTARAKFTMESTITPIGLVIPGINQCNGDDDCGEGQHCNTTNRLCEDL